MIYISCEPTQSWLYRTT